MGISKAVPFSCGIRSIPDVAGTGGIRSG
jgi:hypothetical protein